MAPRRAGQWETLAVMVDRAETRARIAATALAACSAAVTYSIQARFYALGAFAQYDVIFNADTVAYLRIFADGPTRFDYRHPALPLFGHLPVVAASWVVGAAVSRDVLTLLLVALVAAARTLILFALFRRITGGLLAAALLCCIDIVAASTVTVGGIPESYVFSAVCIAAMFWLAARERASAASWLGVATIAIGVTVTNAMAVGLLGVPTLQRGGYSRRRAGVITAGLIVLALAIDTAVAAGLAGYFNYEIVIVETSGRFVHPPELGGAAQLVWTVGHTLLAPAPTTAPLSSPAAAHLPFNFMFGYGPSFIHGWGSLWRAVATALLVGLGGWGAACNARYRPLYVSGTLLVAANVVLHLFYGRWYFLYTPHWQPALVVMIAGAALLPGRMRPVGMAALALFALLAAASTTAILTEMFTRLAA
ncbi:MAG: hypothetical protein ACRERC_08105 [Candidatus Binatia bacterium]